MNQRHGKDVANFDERIEAGKLARLKRGRHMMRVFRQFFLMLQRGQILDFSIKPASRPTIAGIGVDRCRTNGEGSPVAPSCWRDSN